MDFYTVFSEARPVRLNDRTREFAWESLHGKYGDNTMETVDIIMDDIQGFEMMSDYEKYDCAIAEISTEAPIRVCEHELISGAATLGRSIYHAVPAIYNGKILWHSISHTTLGFDRVVKSGVNAIEHEIAARLEDNRLAAHQREVLASMQNSITSMRVWHERYLNALQGTKPAICQNLLHVPFKPARSFYEAVQSLWFTFAFTRLCGNWSAIGRIDALLGGYLTQDLADRILTIDEAREILASFFIKGCEWIQSNTPVGTGDAQHYQNIVLAGIDADGNEITNDVTYLVLDVVEELGISDFPITVRLSEKTPTKLLERMAEVMRHGGGIIAAYNEPLIISSLVNFGYPLEEARQFANDGCWEIQVPGKTCFGYHPFDSLQVLLNDTLELNNTPAHFDDFGSLYAKFEADLKQAVEHIYDGTVMHYSGKSAPDDWTWQSSIPCSVVSMFIDGCVESGRSYLGGGARYTVLSPHIGGAPDVGNSLYAIKKLVFEEQKVSLAELMTILQHNWEGHEALRQYALNKYTYYGNDHDEADKYTSRVLNDFGAIVSDLNDRCPIRFPAGVSTFGRQLEWAPFRAAVPFGRKKGEILAGNASPTPGTDIKGATAIIKSYCKADMRKQVNGAALDVKLYPSTVLGTNGRDALIALLNGFLKLGGFFMQLDVMDAEILRQAQEHPEDYKTLSVRVSGWNARFVTLNKEWQNMIIERTAQGV